MPLFYQGLNTRSLSHYDIVSRSCSLRPLITAMQTRNEVLPNILNSAPSGSLYVVHIRNTLHNVKLCVLDNMHLSSKSLNRKLAGAMRRDPGCRKIVAPGGPGIARCWLMKDK